MGATWIFAGYAGTLKALMRLTAATGWVIVGEPYWRKEPVPEYLKAAGCQRETFGTHTENVETGERLGLRLVHTVISSGDDLDNYEGSLWSAASNTHLPIPTMIQTRLT